MLDYLGNNSDVINVILSMAMLVVWMVYLQIFYMLYARQRRSKILINKAAGNTQKSHCFVSNMSAEIIYIDSVNVTLKNSEDSWSAYITDFDDLSPDQSDKRVQDMTHQGPMQSGNFYDLGSFTDIINWAVKYSNAPKDFLQQDNFALVIRLVGIYGSEKLPVAAEREFTCINGAIEPVKVETDQIRSYLKRRKISKDLRSAYQG